MPTRESPMRPPKVEKEAEFGARLREALARHPQAPDLNYGQLRWIQKTLQSKHDLSVTPESVRQWVNGGSRPKADTLYKLAQILGVDPAWLAFGDGSPALPKSDDDTFAIPAHVLYVIAVCRMHLLDARIDGNQIIVSRGTGQQAVISYIAEFDGPSRWVIADHRDPGPQEAHIAVVPIGGTRYDLIEIPRHLLASPREITVVEHEGRYRIEQNGRVVDVPPMRSLRSLLPHRA